ncbi:MAG: tripartite tricarboxylate transporter substrate-binding protein [Alphaproteobacteria bacterium]|nr:tripartite tricarboxylate transporter substrate-binding protein [Alphaproteobacteria bacterium]
MSRTVKALTALTLGLGVAFMGSAGPASAASVADFYKGKKMTILIGSTVGGGYNQYGRLLGRHMGRHIPGNPTFIPKNMPGAGGRRALAHVAHRAPRDGTVLGILVRSTFFDKLMYPKKAVDVDPTKLTWIGSANKEVGTCIAWHESGFKTLEDTKQKISTMGSSGPASSGTIFPKVLNQVAGTKMKIILGYPGSTQVHLAMERNEVTGRCGMGWDSLMARYRSWYFDKKVSIFLQIGLNKHPKLPDVPLLIDLGRDAKEKAMLTLFSAPNDMGRPYFGPPEIPGDRVKALQAAFLDTMKDEKFLKDAEKLNVAISPLSGEQVAQIVRDVWNTPKEVVQMAQAVLASKKGLQQRKTNYRTVNVTLTKTNKKGSKIYFTDKGKKVYASVSRRSKRSKVTIGGKKAKRGQLKKGMACAVTYEGHKTLAKTVSCQ